MSRRMHFRPYETYFSCPYCAKRWEGPRRARAQGFHHQPKPLAEQDADVQEQYRYAEERREEHLLVNHKAEQIAERMAQIEREATWAHKYATKTGDALDWATHPLAVEWRELMKAWWALPTIPERAARLSPTYNRSLIGKGHVAPLSAGERHMTKVSAHQRKLRLARSAA